MLLSFSYRYAYSRTVCGIGNTLCCQQINVQIKLSEYTSAEMTQHHLSSMNKIRPKDITTCNTEKWPLETLRKYLSLFRCCETTVILHNEFMK